MGSTISEYLDIYSVGNTIPEDLTIYSIEEKDSNYTVTASKALLIKLRSYHEDVGKSLLDSFRVYIDENPRIITKFSDLSEQNIIHIKCSNNYRKYITFSKGHVSIRDSKQSRNIEDEVIFVSYYSYTVKWNNENFQLMRLDQ